MTLKQELQKGDTVSKEIVTQTPAELIASAMQSGTDLAQLESLLTLQERWEGNQAKKSYALAFCAVQKKMGTVTKTKDNKQTHSKYADLTDIIEMAKPIYSAEGFSVIFYEAKTDLPEHVGIGADVLHEQGHKETYHYDVPLDGVGIKGNANMTKIHGKASSTAYGRRYLMCMIWNIPTGDDNDGNTHKGNMAPVTEEQMGTLMEWLLSANRTEAQVCKAIGVENFQALNQTTYARALKALKDTAGTK